MMKPLVMGNWKMHKTVAEAVDLAKEIASGLGSAKADVGVIPPFTALADVGKALVGTSIALGAQDVFPAKEGAFTGEVSPLMLKDLGVSYVLCGHSERRHIIGESDELVGNKVMAVEPEDLNPILCVGEKLEERRSEMTDDVIERQLTLGLMGMIPDFDFDKLVIAYEPVWAIGTGLVAEPQQVEEAHGYVREWLRNKFGEEQASLVRILYGGSVKPDNAQELSKVKNVDGFLVGGASLNADMFLGIIEAYK